ncbi:MAG: MFS transporter [Actinomycetota bacterium]
MDPFGPPVEDPAGESERPGRLAFLRGVTIDLTPLRRSRDFRRLWFGNAISLLGSMLTTVAIPYQVYQLTGSTLAVGLLGIAALVPLLTISFLGGAIADAVDRRLLLIVSDLGLAAISGLLVANSAIEHPRLWALYSAEALGTAFYAIQRPAMDALVPRLVGDENIASAAAVQGIYSSFGHVGGPALGGILIASVGLTATYAIDVVTFTASLIAASLLPKMPPLAAVARPGLKAIAEGFRFVRSKPELKGIFAVDTVAMVFGMPSALFPAFGEHFGGGARTVGFLYAAPYAGALLATLLSGWVTRARRQGLGVCVAASVWGAAIVGFGLAPSLWPALVFLAIAGAADDWSAILRSTILLTVTPDHMRGRLSGIELAQVASAPTLGNVEAGALASFTSLRFSVVSGGLACIAGCWLFVAAVPALLRYDSQRATREAA